MKFIHIADLHLGKSMFDYPLLQDQKAVLEQVIGYAAQYEVDAVVAAGDLYDKPVPPAEAVTVLDGFMTRLSEMGIPLLMVSGNHDSPERLDFGSALLSGRGVYLAGAFNGLPRKVTLGKEGDEADFYLLPFVRPGNVRACYPEEEIRSYDDAVRLVMRQLELSKDRPSVLVAHQFVTAGGSAPDAGGSELLSIGGTDNVDVSNFLPFQYVALGHIHRPQRLTRDSVRYAGSLMKYSFSESRDQKSAVLVTLRGMEEPDIALLPLQSPHDLREVRGPLEKLLSPEVAAAGNPEDYLHVTLTDSEPVADPMQRLRQVYPNVMRLDFAALAPESEEGELSAEEAALRSPEELFNSFSEQMQGVKLSPEEAMLVRLTMDEIWGEPEGGQV